MSGRRTGRRGASAAGPFRRAAGYPGRAAPGGAARVREPSVGPGLAAPSSERLLQCVWYDDGLRPARLRTADGEAVEVVAPGTWNLGPGPDFTGAVVRVGPPRREVRGDVEVHVRPADWTAHGHAADPRYAGVRLHVTFAPGPPPSAPLPAGALRIALREPLAADPAFSFDAVDPTAYPYAVRPPACPCGAVLAGWSAEACMALLDAAGEARLRQKAERFATLARERGIGQAFYEETMATLGYRHNKGAFRRLAERLPLDALREEAAGSPRTAFALLGGLAGLLPAAPRPEWDAATRAELRATWDAWWKRRARWEPRALAPGAWQLAGLRPANHPVRRLRAAAQWFTREPPLLDALRAAARSMEPSALPRHAVALLDTPPEGYWGRRLSWGSTPHARPVALVGRARAAAAVLNAVYPALAVVEPGAIGDLAGLDALPAEADNAILRRTAHALFGRDHPTAWYRNGLRRQGLLHVFHDYCLTDRTGCAACSFPRRLTAFRAEFP